ncbi:hypothetical protein BC832DRAFT_588242 [Gaertneriomyces semiglobifer]|nr:hypothetical protein BC832DRAFT_588242 [Gaertneriomyces semiglobifer]
MSNAIDCEQRAGRSVEYVLARELRPYEELPGESDPMWNVVTADILANPGEYEVRKGCDCSHETLCVLDPDRMSAAITKILRANMPAVDWRNHPAPVVVAARLIATAHALGGDVVAYSVQSRQNRPPRITWHWSSHVVAAEWCSKNTRPGTSFGKHSAFFQTGPWIGQPAAPAQPQPVVPRSQAVAMRRPTEIASTVGAHFDNVPPVVLRMLAEGMADVGEEVCKSLMHELWKPAER